MKNNKKIYIKNKMENESNKKEELITKQLRQCRNEKKNEDEYGKTIAIDNVLILILASLKETIHFYGFITLRNLLKIGRFCVVKFLCTNLTAASETLQNLRTTKN